MKDYLSMVEMILREHPEARDDDMKLFVWVCSITNKEVMGKPFSKVLWYSSKIGLPSYESITRCRRKLQETHEELRGNKYKIRQERQADYIEEFGRRTS